MPSGIRLDRTAVHIAVDMQCLFAERTEWFVPWLPKVLPNVLAIADRHPDRTIFTRFIPPQDPEHATGAWRDYFERWRSMTRDRIDPRLLELVEPLRKLVPPAKVLNKTAYSAFAHPRLAHALRRHGVETLIVTGGETDVCVLATVMAAVDLGFRVVLPAIRSLTAVGVSLVDHDVRARRHNPSAPSSFAKRGRRRAPH